MRGNFCLRGLGLGSGGAGAVHQLLGRTADPFLRPALERNTAAAERAMAEVIDKAASQSGW